MTTLTARATTADNPAFQARVRQALVSAAIDIDAEAADHPNHENRRTLASQVLNGPYSWAQIIAVGVAQNPNIGSGSSDPSDDSPDGDSAMQYVVNGLWDAYCPPAPTTKEPTS